MDEKKDNSTNSFDEYRAKMHPEQEEGRSVVPTPKKSVAYAFGIFMILVYVGVGVLMLINYFKWGESWTAMRYIVGVMLIIYGIYRGYRQFSGTDYYSK